MQPQQQYNAVVGATEEEQNHEIDKLEEDHVAIHGKRSIPDTKRTALTFQEMT